MTTPNAALSLHIRPAAVTDTDTILHFIRELAIYEKAEHEALATPGHIHHTLFGPQPTVFGLICELGGQPIGFAVYFFNYSKAKKKTSKASSKKSRKTLATLTLLEFLSWNKLISAAKDLDNNIILHMLSRFKNVAIN